MAPTTKGNAKTNNVINVVTEQRNNVVMGNNATKWGKQQRNGE